MIKRLTIIFLLAASSYGATSWPLTIHLPEVPDSFVAIHYYGTAIYEEVHASGVDSLAHTWQIQDNSLNQIVFKIWWQGQDSATGWTFVRDPKTTYGATEAWPLYGALWSEETDSAKYRRYEDGVQIGSTATRGSTVRRYDTTAYATAGKYNEVRLTLFYPSASPATWDWVWDLTDTAGIVVDTSTESGLCRVYGRVRSSTNGAFLKYAKVRFELAGTPKNSCDSAVLVPSVTEAETDASGNFEAYLTWSACLNNSPYNMVVTYNGNKTYSKTITVPSTDSYRVIW